MTRFWVSKHYYKGVIMFHSEKNCNAIKTVKIISQYMRKRDLCMVKGGMDFTDTTWTSE